MNTLYRITQILILGATLGIANLYAADIPVSAPLTLKSLMEARSHINESSSVFKEEKLINAFNESIQLEGTLYYRSPNHLVKQYTSPDEIRYEITDNTILIKQLNSETQEREELNINLDDIPVLHVFITGLRGIMSGNIESIREFFDIDFSANKLKWEINLVPKQDSTREYISALVINGSDSQILQITTRETSGDITTTKIQPEASPKTLQH